LAWSFGISVSISEEEEEEEVLRTMTRWMRIHAAIQQKGPCVLGGFFTLLSQGEPVPHVLADATAVYGSSCDGNV
jgi:hypothetical protein